MSSVNESIVIPKEFLKKFWRFESNNGIPINIQQYRFLFNTLLLYKKDEDVIVSSRKVYNDVFSYKNSKGTTKYLMNLNKWKEFIYSLKNLYPYNEIDKTLLFKFSNNLNYRINGSNKKDWDEKRQNEIYKFKSGKLDATKIRPEYESFPYTTVKLKIWETLRTSKDFNLIKLFHYILWMKVSNPRKVFTVKLQEISNVLMIKIIDFKKFKYRVSLHLEKLIELGLIEKWSFEGYNLTIIRK